MIVTSTQRIGVKEDIDNWIDSITEPALHQNLIFTKLGMMKKMTMNKGSKIIKKGEVLDVNQSGFVLSKVEEGESSDGIKHEDISITSLLDELVAHKKYTSRLVETYRPINGQSFASLIGDDIKTFSKSISIDIENRSLHAAVSEIKNTLTASGVGQVVRSEDFERVYDILYTQNNSPKFIDRIEATVKISTVPLFASYVAVAHPSIIFDVEKLPNWSYQKNYADSGRISTAEKGALENTMIRFVQSNSPILLPDEDGFFPIIIMGADAFTIYTLGGGASQNMNAVDEYSDGISVSPEYNVIGRSTDNPDNTIASILGFKFFYSFMINQQLSMMILRAKKA